MPAAVGQVAVAGLLAVLSVSPAGKQDGSGPAPADPQIGSHVHRRPDTLGIPVCGIHTLCCHVPSRVERSRGDAQWTTPKRPATI